ncbi:MAG: hypothetical protein ACRDFW_14565, partial [bacterium]
MRRFSLFALVCAATLGLAMPVGAVEEQPTQVAAATSSLDGTTWQVKVTPDEASKNQPDAQAFDNTLSFQNGQLTSSECTKAGFNPSAYSPSPAGNGWTFRSQQANQKVGKTEWVGQATGENIKGTMSLTKNDGSRIQYN